MEQNDIKTPREIGRMIAAYFKEHHILQEVAAERLGFASKQVVANQLYGKRFGRATAAKYATVFGFDEMFLLTGKGELFAAPSVENKRLKEENEKLLAIIASQQETINKLSGQLQYTLAP